MKRLLAMVILVLVMSATFAIPATARPCKWASSPGELNVPTTLTGDPLVLTVGQLKCMCDAGFSSCRDCCCLRMEQNHARILMHHSLKTI
jgi:hypothetical protein